MENWLTVDWAKLFIPGGLLLELLIRGTFVYLGLLFVLRFLRSRQLGTFGISDLLV